ncbi:MAG: GntR family transcriptional regulator [Actinomycetota bacterium]
MTNLPATKIDRSSPVPYYFQLRKLLAEEISAARWVPGVRTPSEPDICRHFDVSRTTVRQALAALESEGLIRKEKGRGTFVAEPRSSSWFLQSSGGFFDAANRTGRKVTSQVRRAEISDLPSWAADSLNLAEGSKGVTLERVRWVDDRLVMYVQTHLPERFAEVVTSSDLENRSLYQALEERLGVSVASGRRLVEATTAEDDLANVLDVPPGSPLLFVQSVSLDTAGQPFECYRAWHRADRTKIEVHVVNQDVATRAGFDPVTMRISGGP